jgi:tRNA (cmo5U34)-methyltransferase
MSLPSDKSTVAEIRTRFDNDVERFSNLETGQTSTMDAAYCLDLVAQAARASTPTATSLLDIGCGAGNFSLKLLEVLPGMEVTLIDLSQPMLARAAERLAGSSAAKVTPLQGDIRELELPTAAFDVVIAAAVLHHLRSNDEWAAVFQKIFLAMKPGGWFWIFDLVDSSTPSIEGVMRSLYGDYLTGLKDAEYRDHVFAYIAKEDTPKPLMFQLHELLHAGFEPVEILHKHVSFAAFGGRKPA